MVFALTDQAVMRFAARAQNANETLPCPLCDRPIEIGDEIGKVTLTYKGKTFECWAHALRDRCPSDARVEASWMRSNRNDLPILGFKPDLKPENFFELFPVQSPLRS